MVIIQTEEIKQYVKKYQHYGKNYKSLQANLETVIPITTDRIRRITRIYQSVSNIQLILAVKQGQEVYI